MPSNSSNSSAPTQPARSARSAGGRGWRWRIRGCRRKPIPWCFTEKDAIAPHQSEKVPVLLDGDNVGRRFLGDRELSGRRLSGPAVAVRRRGRPRHGPDAELVGRCHRDRRHVSADRRRHPRASEAGGRRLFPQVPRSALRQAAGRGGGGPRQDPSRAFASRSIRCG